MRCPRQRQDSAKKELRTSAHTSITNGTDADGTDAGGTDAGGTDADGTDAGGAGGVWGLDEGSTAALRDSNPCDCKDSRELSGSMA